MIKAQSLTPTWYIPESEKDAASPSRFRIRPLSAHEWYELSDAQGHITAAADVVLGRGLLGWENVESADGAALAFSAENVWLLPPTLLDKIGAHIIEISRLSEAAEKN